MVLLELLTGKRAEQYDLRQLVKVSGLQVQPVYIVLKIHTMFDLL
jgi:hypothetical protein